MLRLTGTGSPRIFYKYLYDPSLGPRTGLAQRDRSRGLHASEEATTSAPPSTPPQGVVSSSHELIADVHWSTLQDASCASLEAGQPAESHRSSTERGEQRGQLV
jgi:hypothetical protein